MITENSLKDLRSAVEKRLSSARYLHTLGVERSAMLLGEYCLPSDIFSLRAAALLHDIAKEYSDSQLTSLLRGSAFSLTDEDLLSPQILHSFAAPIVIRSDFPEFSEPNILSATEKHTVGASDMTLFDEIIFISDFIEDTRKYDACKRMRLELISALVPGDFSANALAVHKSCIATIEFTEKFLRDKGRPINERMINAKNALKAKILQR